MSVCTGHWQTDFLFVLFSRFLQYFLHVCFSLFARLCEYASYSFHVELCFPCIGVYAILLLFHVGKLRVTVSADVVH